MLDVAERLRGLPCKTIECDEIWAFCYAKQKNVPEQFKGTPGCGDVWTWTALCADTKLVPSWLVGERTIEDATAFMHDLRGRLAEPRVQITTDGLRAYRDAVGDAFETVDFAQLHKVYGLDPTIRGAQRRYSPPMVTSTQVTVVSALRGLRLKAAGQKVISQSGPHGSPAGVTRQ